MGRMRRVGGIHLGALFLDVVLFTLAPLMEVNRWNNGSAQDRLRFEALSLVGRLIVGRIEGADQCGGLFQRIDHCIQFDRIHTFEHRPSQSSPALLRRNAAWSAVGRLHSIPCDSVLLPYSPSADRNKKGASS